MGKITKDERKWLEAAKAGRYDAFEKLAAAYEGRIFNFALRMCGHTEDARDVLQETLLAAFQSLRHFRGEAKLSTWFFKVAMSACQKMRRKGKFQPDFLLSLEQSLPRLESQFGLEHSGPGPEKIAWQREEKRFLDQAIRAVPLRYRLVLVLRDVQGFSTEEVGEILKLKVPVVKVRLHRARLFLKQRLMEYLRQGLPRGRAQTRMRSSDCREAARLLSGFMDGELQEELCGKIQDHLDGCDACVSLCDSLRETVSLCQKSKRRKVPPPVRRRAHAFVQETL